MQEIEELILYENENTRLDFKRDEYRKENYASFLKDVLSMSNAITNEDRYIFIGLKPVSSDDRGLIGIKNSLTDAATFQQLVFENIEPEIKIDYFPFEHNELLIGVLKIMDCNNPPYLMKKDYGNGKNKLFRGDGFIRKGTHQTRLVRKDYDKFTKQKIDDKYFTEDVEFSLVTTDGINKIKVQSFEDIERPSQIKKERIKEVLKVKKEQELKHKKLGISGFDPNILGAIPVMFGGSNSYENRDISTLENNLKNVEETYFEHDCYELFEKLAKKYNISIFNKGHNYIEDASIQITIPKLDGLIIADQIYRNPENDSINQGVEMSFLHYPNVTEQDNYYSIIEDSIGNIKHQKKQDAFDTEISILASSDLKGKTITIVFELFAKNIKTSIKKELTIEFK